MGPSQRNVHLGYLYGKVSEAQESVQTPPRGCTLFRIDEAWCGLRCAGAVCKGLRSAVWRGGTGLHLA